MQQLPQQAKSLRPLPQMQQHLQQAPKQLRPRLPLVTNPEFSLIDEVKKGAFRGAFCFSTVNSTTSFTLLF